jgi:hypothetical protein
MAKLIGVGNNARTIREATACNNNTGKNANVEHDAGHGGKGNARQPTVRRDSGRPCKKDGTPPYIQGSVRLRITHYRYNLADSEGYCIKYAIDALVRAGILLDDNPEVIPQRLEEFLYKIDPTDQERVVVEIYKYD